MASKSKHVYCFQLGDADCFKIGRSVSPDKRKGAFSTASPVELIERRRESTEYPEELEKYIHKLLDGKRAKNRRELFNVTMQEVNEAFDAAIPNINAVQPCIRKAEELAKKRPATRTMLKASDEIREIYRQLRQAQRDQFFLQHRIEVLESKMKIATGDNLGISGVISWDWRPSFRVDITKLKKARPKLYKLLLERFKGDSSGRRCDWL